MSPAPSSLVNNEEQQLILTGLARDTTYVLVIQAYNSAGNGPLSQQLIVGTSRNGKDFSLAFFLFFCRFFLLYSFLSPSLSSHNFLVFGGRDNENLGRSLTLSKKLITLITLLSPIFTLSLSLSLCFQSITYQREMKVSLIFFPPEFSLPGNEAAKERESERVSERERKREKVKSLGITCWSPK